MYDVVSLIARAMDAALTEGPSIWRTYQQM